MKKENLVWGVLLIIIGCTLILNNILDLRIFSMSNFWPVFVLAVGLVFEISYFTHRTNPGLLVPGGILISLGILFFFEAFTGWRLSEYTWPAYNLAVAIGLFQLYLFSGKKKGLLVPVFILTAISAISFAIMFLTWVNSSIICAAIFILIGGCIIYRSCRK